MSDVLLFDMQNCYDKFQKGGIDIASIVKRNKISVVCTSYEGGKRSSIGRPITLMKRRFIEKSRLNSYKKVEGEVTKPC